MGPSWNVLCLDVLRHSFAADLLEQLTSRLGTTEVRLDRGLAASIRHGEVIRAHVGSPAAVDVGSISALPDSGAAASWRREGSGCYVLGPLTDLQWHEDLPFAASPTTQHAVVPCCHGKQTVSEVHRAHRCPLQTPVYCEVGGDQICHLFVVCDAHGVLSRPILQAIAKTPEPQAALAELTHPDNPYAAFWSAVRRTMPVVLFSSSQDAEQGRLQPVLCHLVLVDLLRAAQFGWQLRQVDSPIIIQSPSHQPSAPTQQSKGVQTLSRYWPHAADPIQSASLPLLQPARGCLPYLRLCPAGTPYTLVCDTFQVTCQVPCLPGYHVWALRIGAYVHGACTSSMDWSYILDVADSNVWDLPGTSIIGDQLAWEWPQELQGFSGHCGHLVHSGEDPYLGIHCSAGSLGRSLAATNATPAPPL